MEVDIVFIFFFMNLNETSAELFRMIMFNVEWKMIDTAGGIEI